MESSLYLYEEILLLALKDQKGTIDWRAGLFLNVIAGAIIAELVLTDRIQIENNKKKHMVVTNENLIGDPVLDQALEKVNKSKNKKSLEDWISKLASISKLKEKIAKQLCNKGILREEKRKIMGLFKTKRYPELNPEPEKRLIQRLEKALFSEQTKTDLRTTILISLTYQSDLLSIPFQKKDIKHNKQKIERIIRGEHIGRATHEVIETLEAVLAITTIMPVITLSATNT
jgi:hypothetical protein